MYKNRVIIKNSGPIGPLRNIYGPVLTPTKLEKGVVERLIVEGYKVFAVYKKNEVRLTIGNYDTDLFKSVIEKEKSQRAHQQQQKKQNQQRQQNQQKNNNRSNNNKRVEDPIVKK